ncbi:MAG: alpha-L-fucosidase, partial [Candidatus Sumerlaeota bacterium]|nr:alpha-L-fucosidase [Candidatus Sumerlaeota bacterium]
STGEGFVMPKETQEQKDARMRWWREARFGMFVHWGPVSLKGTEIGWSRNGPRPGVRSQTWRKDGIPLEIYDNLYKEWNPTEFHADNWVKIAQDAGMKYLVFTTKHHDGFVEFDSALTDYKITSPLSPYGRDIVAQLADACHKGGLRLGFYYSPPDFHHPDYRTENHARYIEYLHGQLKELCGNYGPVDIIWFDGLGGKADDWDSERLFQEIHALQPNVIINNRAGLPGDYDTPEQRIGGFQIERPWETCMTICRQWAWKPGDTMKSLEQCIQTLVRVVGGDGNFLFNVGPMPDGRIEPRQVDRLREMGEWLRANGESVYGTRGGPFKPGAWGASTRQGNRIYVHVLKWPESGLVLPPIGKKIVKSSLLSGGAVEVNQTDEGISIAVEPKDRQPLDTIAVLDLDGPVGDITPVGVKGSGALSSGKKATASNVFQKNSRFATGKAFDDDEETRWATDSKTREAWLEVDLGKPCLIGRAVILEAYAGRVQEFEVQAGVDGEWKTVHRGTTLGERAAIEFDPVTAQRVRLNILRSTDGPTIKEFQLFNPAK